MGNLRRFLSNWNWIQSNVSATWLVPTIPGSFFNTSRKKIKTQAENSRKKLNLKEALSSSSINTLCHFLCHFYEQVFSNYTNFNYLFTKLLITQGHSIQDNPYKKLHDFKGSFRKNHVQLSITLPKSMTLPDNLPTTIFSVKLMHLCIWGPLFLILG